MSLSINLFFLMCLNLFYVNKAEYKYILICTPKNCAPCIVTADDYFNKNKSEYVLIKLYDNKAEIDYTNKTVKTYCQNSKATKVKAIKNTFSFGAFKFTVNNNGPFVIKYSKTDTVVFNSLTIDDINS